MHKYYVLKDPVSKNYSLFYDTIETLTLLNVKGRKKDIHFTFSSLENLALAVTDISHYLSRFEDRISISFHPSNPCLDYRTLNKEEQKLFLRLIDYS